MESGSPKSQCRQGHTPSEGSKGDSFFVSSSFWRFQALLCLRQRNSSPCLPLRTALSSSCLMSPCFSHFRTPDTGFRTQQDFPRPSHLRIFNLITYANVGFYRRSRSRSVVEVAGGGRTRTYLLETTLQPTATGVT